MAVIYVVDRMILADSRFGKVRQFRKHLQDTGIDYLVVDEVAYESRDADDYNIIYKEASRKITPEHVSKLKMVVPELISQGVLSMDQGNGDAMLAVECMVESPPTLFGSPSKTLVTNDKKLSEYCRSKNIDVMSPGGFFRMIDGVVSSITITQE